MSQWHLILVLNLFGRCNNIKFGFGCSTGISYVGTIPLSSTHVHLFGPSEISSPTSYVQHFSRDLCLVKNVSFICLIRFARFYEKDGKLHRTLFKAYGIRYVVLVYGQVC